VRELNTGLDAWAAKRGYELDSFRPGKDWVSSVYKIACEVGRQNEYDTIYRSLSNSAHGSHVLKSLIITAQI
jgi:Family of unknown function (DUF5677)